MSYPRNVRWRCRRYDLRDKLEPIGRLDVLDDVAKKAKEYLDRLPKELVTPSRLKQQETMLSNLGDVLVAQGKLQEALEVYQQSLAIFKRLAEQDKTNSGWQRDLIVSLYKVATPWRRSEVMTGFEHKKLFKKLSI